MKMSDTITEIAGALAKAQGMIDDASKTGLNPAFRSKYADLASVRAAIREPLAVNDLAIVQGPRRTDGGVEVETMILHKSGEWISENVFIPVNKWDAHGIGSGITYGRRYGLMALLCIAADDDDGNAAVEKGPQQPPRKEEKKFDPMIVEFMIEAGTKVAEKEGTPGLTRWWKTLTTEQRQNFPDDARAGLKKIAATFDAKDKTDDQQ